jgi:hypothetical protein
LQGLREAARLARCVTAIAPGRAAAAAAPGRGAPLVNTGLTTLYFAEGGTGRLSTTGLVIHNAPRTAVVGRTERFSALLSGQPHTLLIYMLRYPDGHVERVPVRTDGHGYSSHTFHMRPYAARRFRETATISIEDAGGRVLAFTRFAIQPR